MVATPPPPPPVYTPPPPPPPTPVYTPPPTPPAPVAKQVQTLKAEEYSKICNDTLYIKNDQMTLTVKDCDGKKVKFSVKRTFNNKTLLEREFEFDFRYYQPVMNNG